MQCKMTKVVYPILCYKPLLSSKQPVYLGQYIVRWEIQNFEISNIDDTTII